MASNNTIADTSSVAESSTAAVSSTLADLSSSSVEPSTTESTTTPSSTLAPTTTSDTPTPTSTIPSSTAAPTSTTSTTSAAPSSTTSAEIVTSSVAASTTLQPSTEIYTSIVTQSATNAEQSATPVVITVTATSTNVPATAATTTGASGTSGHSSTAPAALQTTSQDSSGTGSGGLSTGGKTAVAVVVPVVVVALLVLAGIFLWRKRKQRKIAEEDRRKEVEEYGFNPNNDPTLPAVGGGFGGSEMAEDASGYRGWGNTTNTSNRKASTTISGGITHFSDTNSNQGGYHSPGSPTHGAGSAAESGDALMAGRRETMDSEGIGALGQAPVAGANRPSDIHRGPSNASSSYSGAGHSDSSDPGPAVANPQDYYSDNGYYQPYNQHAYDGQPIVQNVAARRNTRIENPSSFPPAGNSGIAQNF